MKKLRIFLLVFLISIFFIPKVNASVDTNNGKFPDIPTDIKNYMISYYGNNNNFYLAYCKNDDEVLIPISEALSQGTYAIGYCYNKNTKRSTGNAYRRSFVATGMSANNILSKNISDFSSFSWGTEQQGTWYTSTVMYKYNNLNRLVIVDDYTNYNNMGSTWGYVFYINENIYNNWGNGVTLTDNLIILNKDLFSINLNPTYTYTTEVLDNGSVELNLEFSNYTEGSNYGFEIYNFVSGEYYGVTNPFGNYPNIIPYESSYSITVPFDTSIYIKLYKYENESRELINQNVIDLNNIVFENPQDPYFKILDQSNNRIRGIFENTESGYSCYYSNSNNNIVGVVICDEEEVNEVFNFNGYVNFYIENQNGNIIYSRKVNVLGADSTPYIIYSVEKQDFYNVIKWEVKNKNLDPNMKYRYSTNNGTSYSEWETIGNEYKDINVYSNTTAIIQISNSDNTTIYDSKAINVIENLNTLKTFNKSSSNLINIFNNMFNVNSNILPKITNLWNNIKNTKAYLIIFIPFISSLIGGIIYLIRRK